MKKLIDILNGIADGIFPNVTNSIKHTNDGREINRARLTASVLSFIIFVALLRGWISFKQIADLIKIIFTVE